MIPFKVLEALQFVSRVGYRLDTLPFEWDLNDFSSGSVRWTKCKWRLRVHYLLAAYTAFNFCFMAVRWFQSLCCIPNVTYGMLIGNLFNVLTTLDCTVLYLNMFLRSDEMLDFIRHFMATNQKFKERFCPNSSEEKGVSLVRRIVLPIYAYSILQFFVAIKTADKNPKYLYYFVEGLKRWPKFARIPIGVFEVYFSLTVATMLMFHTFFYLAYVHATCNCLKALRIGILGCITRPYYQQLLIVNAQFQNLFRYAILPLITSMLLGFSVTAMYAAVKLSREVKMPEFLAFPLAASASFGCLLEMLPQAYRVSQFSRNLIEESKYCAKSKSKPNQGSGGSTSTNSKRKVNPNRSGVEFKELESLRPILIRVGPFYTVQRSTLLIFLYIGLDVTINLLITF